MRIEELSIGDWVQIGECGHHKGSIAKVWWLSRDSNHIGLFDTCVFSECEDDVLPIPLTPEILEKNGLCVVEEDADFSEYELFGSENFSIFHLNGTLHYRLETPQASVVCWNVHQLQHALRLAGVEKEIEV